jgi:hypothetical protein
MYGRTSKMAITQEERPMGPYHFRLSLVSLAPTYGQNISLKAVNYFECFLRESLNLKSFVKRLARQITLAVVSLKFFG